MQSSTKLPSPEAADPKEVALALEEAIALSATGKKDDSIRALSRAADAADAAGVPARAVVIRAALVELGSGGPATAARAATGRPPPPSAVRAASMAPKPPSAAAPSHAPPPPSARAATEVARAPSIAPAPAAPSSPPPSAPPAHSAPPTATAVDASAALAAATAASALHVWVRASARDPSLLLVRLLPDGHPAPPGSYEAFLRPAREDENLFAPKH
jgi:hypothetical protein